MIPTKSLEPVIVGTKHFSVQWIYPITSSSVYRNACSQTVQQLQDLSRDPAAKLEEIPDPEQETSSTSLDLLLRFQRLLVAKLFPLEQGRHKAIVSDPG